MKNDVYQAPKVSAEASIEFARSLASAFLIRINEARDAGKILPLDEKEAWKKLLDLINPDLLEGAADIFPQLVEQLEDDNRFQARVELGRIANLEP